MTKTVLLAGAAALALTGGANAAVDQHAKGAFGAHGTATHVIHAPPKGSTTLYDQNIGDTGYGFFSQTLSSYPQYDEYLADDFTVPSGHTWKVTEVDVTGFYYIEYGPASSVNVLFWKDKGGLPSSKKGAAVECDNITPKSGLDTGSFQIKLPKGCAAKFKGGNTYWVTVQANLNGPFTSGYWAWTANSAVAGNVSAGWWYGGGVSVPPECATAFHSLTECTGSTFDFAFALQGKDKS
jgi:hypothetical protein